MEIIYACTYVCFCAFQLFIKGGGTFFKEFFAADWTVNSCISPTKFISILFGDSRKTNNKTDYYFSGDILFNRPYAVHFARRTALIMENLGSTLTDGYSFPQRVICLSLLHCHLQKSGDSQQDFQNPL